MCHRHLSPGWQNVILFYFFTITAWEGNGLLSRSAGSVLRRSFFLKHVNRIRERDLELKQLRLKFFEIKLISAINGTSHLTFRHKQKNGYNKTKQQECQEMLNVCSPYNHRALEIQHKSPPKMSGIPHDVTKETCGNEGFKHFRQWG